MNSTFLIVALKIRKRKLQLQTCDDKENNSYDASNDQKGSSNWNSTAPKIYQNLQLQKCDDEKNRSCSASIERKKPMANKQRSKTEKRPSNQIRYSSGHHTAEAGDERVRCKLEKCPYKSYVKCIKCNVHLCVNKRNCFADFHNINAS